MKTVTVNASVRYDVLIEKGCFHTVEKKLPRFFSAKIGSCHHHR